MRIIPAIDIIEGKCVRLSKGNYNTKKIYNENPLEVAKEFEDQGVEYLHLVDLDGAKSQHIINHKVLENIAYNTNLRIDFGGGIKSNNDIRTAFQCGAQKVTIGSVAVKDVKLFESWIEAYGIEKIILGADVQKDKIAVHGWQKTSDQSVIPFIKKYHKKGVKYIICTDISKDGMLEGPSDLLYRNIINQCPEIALIASGGVSSVEDLQRLSDIGCESAIIGKALYEGYIDLKALKDFL